MPLNAQTRIRRPSSITLLGIAYIALSAVAPPIAGADPPAARTTRTLESRVSLADLDLSTPEGVRAAHKRLSRKAEYSCRQLWDSVSATYRWSYAACVKATLADAVQQLNVPALSAENQSRTEP
jgi:UrcA family protein